MCRFSSSINIQLKKRKERKKERRRNTISRKTALFERHGRKLKWGLLRLQDRKKKKKQLNPDLNCGPSVQPVREAGAVGHSGTPGGL